MNLKLIVLLIFLPFIAQAQDEKIKYDSLPSEVKENYFSPLNVSLGVNLDYNESKLRGLYFSLNVFVPDLIKIGKGGFGFDTGMRKRHANFLGIESTDVSLIKPVMGDSFNSFYKEITNYVQYTDQSAKNINIYFNPIFKILTRKNKAKDQVSQLFFSIDFDILLSSVTNRYSYDTLSIYRVSASFTEFGDLSDNRLIDSEFYAQFAYTAGFGIPFIVSNKWGIIKGKLNAGLSTIIGDDIRLLSRENYGLNLEIIERKYGLHVSTEVRFIGDRKNPFISIGLAKYFNFKNGLKFYPS